MRVQRLEPGSNGRKKSFRQHKAAGVRLAPDGITRVTIWESGVRGVKTVPYRLPLLLDPSRSSEIVFITEGEKCADLLHSLGLLATTAPEGSEKFSKLSADVIAKAFTNRRVVILPDNDSGGYGHARQVASLVSPVASAVRILPLDDLREPKDDVFEWLTEYGHTVEELLRLAEESLAGPQRELSGPTAMQATQTTANAIEGSTRGEGVSGGGSNPAMIVNEDASDPHRLARAFLEQFAHPDRCRLVYWREEFWEWRDGAYSCIPIADVRPRLNLFIKSQFDADYSGRLADWVANGGKGKPPTVLHVTPTIVRSTIDAMHGLTHILVDAPPAWIGNADQPCHFADVKSCVVFRNGIVDLHEFTAGGSSPLFAPTPNLFTMVSCGYDFDPNAGEPVEWLRFLRSVWTSTARQDIDTDPVPTTSPADSQPLDSLLDIPDPDDLDAIFPASGHLENQPDPVSPLETVIDQDSIDCLQEWFGYLLTQDNSLQKILFLKGVPRSGKGTIQTIIANLVGENSCAAANLSNFASDFGSSEWVGKSVIIVGDARVGGHRPDMSQIVENLLSISGNDKISINRKYCDRITMRLVSRIVIASNEFPKLTDDSKALSTRFIILQFNNSFLGREDTTLADRLSAELPQIFLWAVKGWERLRKNNKFTEPQGSVDEREELAAILSPVSVFVEDCCEIGTSYSESCSALFESYVKWCEKSNVIATSKTMFGKRLKEAFPSVKSQPKRLHKTGYKDVRKCYFGIRLKDFVDL
jgi:putative DNA primase/helicase